MFTQRRPVIIGNLTPSPRCLYLLTLAYAYYTHCSSVTTRHPCIYSTWSSHWSRWLGPLYISHGPYSRSVYTPVAFCLCSLVRMQRGASVTPPSLMLLYSTFARAARVRSRSWWRLYAGSVYGVVGNALLMESMSRGNMQRNNRRCRELILNELKCS